MRLVVKWVLMYPIMGYNYLFFMRSRSGTYWGADGLIFSIKSGNFSTSPVCIKVSYGFVPRSFGKR